jgi:hypothetical protein
MRLCGLAGSQVAPRCAAASGGRGSAERSAPLNRALLGKNRREDIRHFALQVGAVVIVDLQGLQARMPGKPLNAPNVASCRV